MHLQSWMDGIALGCVETLCNFVEISSKQFGATNAYHMREHNHVRAAGELEYRLLQGMACFPHLELTVLFCEKRSHVPVVLHQLRIALLACKMTRPQKIPPVLLSENDETQTSIYKRFTCFLSPSAEHETSVKAELA
eukprot:6211522-Pleurochrysis_carterae.AAC.2